MLNIPFFDGSVNGGVGITFDNGQDKASDDAGEQTKSDIEPRFVFGIGFDVDILGYLNKKLFDPKLTYDP